MYNDYYLLKKIDARDGDIVYASAQDGFTYMGEVVKVPLENDVSLPVYKAKPKVGDKVRFLKGSGEDISDTLKAVKFEDLIMPI